MKNIDAFKRFAFVDLLLLGFASGSFAQDNPCADAPDAPKNEHLLYSMNGNVSEILTTEKFKQTLDPSKKLWWFKSMDEPNSKGTNSVLIDRSVPTYNLKPYEFFIAYQDGDCFGERAKVVVEVLAAPTPSVKDIDLCKDGTFDPLDGIVATDAGYELIWFKSPTDTAGKALSSAPTDVVDVTTPGKYILYVAQRATTEPYAQSDVIDIGVDVIAVEKPKVNHSVSYVKSEAVSTKEFVDILVKSPDVIDNVEGQTLLWAKDQLGVYEKGSTSSSKPYYDELLPVGLVEKQDRWVKWQLVTAAGLVCESEPEKIDIIISSTPAPIVRKIEICEDVFKGGGIPSDKEPANNALINNNNGSLPDAEKYELVWFDNQQDADESMTNSSKLTSGRKTAPTLTDVFSGVDLSDPYESEWRKSLYVVQTYDDGNGNITTSPASEMKIFINAIPKLKEIAHEPVCMGPVNLTDNKFWNVFNGVKVDAEYLYNGSSVTQSATNLTKAGKYTINATSSLGCKSEPLEVQLDIRNLSLEIDQKSLVNPGFELSMMVNVNFSYNENGRESKAGKVKLFWSSEENISDKPTDLGELTPDVKSFIYETGKFDGKPGDTHTITISVTDGYCMSKATHIVTVEKQSAVDPITAEKADDIVNVYTVSGALVKANVKRSEALKGLLEGIYVVGNEKMIVR